MAQSPRSTVDVSQLALGFHFEESLHTAGDHTFAVVPDYLKCDSDGLLTVDTLSGQVAVEILVLKGVNEPVRKIYLDAASTVRVWGVSQG